MFLLEKWTRGGVMTVTGVLTWGTLCGEPTEHLAPPVSDLELGRRFVFALSQENRVGSLIQSAPSRDPGEGSPFSYDSIRVQPCHLEQGLEVAPSHGPSVATTKKEVSLRVTFFLLDQPCCWKNETRGGGTWRGLSGVGGAVALGQRVDHRGGCGHGLSWVAGGKASMP